MKQYKVIYAETSALNSKEIEVIAKNSAEAYDKAIDMFNPYSAYVEGYTAKNGSYHLFSQNCFGNAY